MPLYRNGKEALEATLDVNSQLLSNAWEALADMHQQGYRFSYAPNAAWTTGNTGSGSVAYDTTNILLDSGATANSVASGRGATIGIGQTSSTWNWAKKLLLVFYLRMADTPDAQTAMNIQLKAATTHGNLAAAGLGFNVVNLTLNAELHDGTNRSTVGSGALTGGKWHEVVLEWDGSTTFEGFLDGTSLGTITTNLPTGTTIDIQLVASLTNGTTAAQQRARFAVAHFERKD